MIETIQAINDAPIEAARPALAKATDWLGKSTTMIDNRIINALYRVGGADHVRKVLELACDTRLPDTVREECLFVLRRWENPPAADPTTGTVRPLNNDRSLAAVRGEIAATLGKLLADTEGNFLADVIETIKHFGVQADQSTMIGHFRNVANPASIRLAALHMLLPNSSKALLQPLKDSLEDHDVGVRTQSYTALSQIDPAFALEHADRILASDRVADRQHLFRTLGTMPGQGAAGIILDKLKSLPQQDPAIQLDILEAARVRTEPDVVRAVADYQNSLDGSDPLAAFRISLHGGDVGAGRRIFYGHSAAECSRCHIGLPKRQGGDAGPSLSNIGHLDPEYLLESIVLPNAKTAAGFGIISLTFHDGTMVAGRLMKEDADSVTVADMATGKSTTYPRKDIASSTQPASTMPPMGAILNKSEIRDVIAFLKTLRHGN